MPWAGRRLHFVGIGGAGMSGLAVVARALGAQVTGSDRAPDSPYLRSAGIVAAAGHDAAHVPEGAEVVVSSAIAADNPERVAARERGLRELHRADLLGEITRLRPTIAVTGTHGKTTTSSMVVHALRGCGMDPGYLVGGEVRSTGSNAGWGAGEWLVVEADESDRSLLKLAPRIAVLTNAELDHHATYASQRDVDDTFRAFLDMADEVVLGDEPDLERFRGTIARPEHVELEPGGSRFSVAGVPVTLPVPGVHNARNAATALAACTLAGADPARAAAALADFGGAGRRFERIGDHADGAPTWSTTTRTTRPRCGPRSPPPARSHRAGWWWSSSRTCSRARATSSASSARRSRSPTSSSCSTSTRRASAPRTSRASPGGWWPRRPPTVRAAARSRGCRASTRPSDSCAPSCGTAICCSRSGRANVDALGRRLAGV